MSGSAATGLLQRQWSIASAPDGIPKRENFEYVEQPRPRPGPGQVLLRTLYLGVAPVMRMYMQGAGAAGERALGKGDVIHGRGVAQIVESLHPDYAVGEIVQGQLGWQTWKVSAMTAAERMIRMPESGLPLSYGTHVLGMKGLSAYAGFFWCGEPAPGDTVVVSGAAGGVGSLVVQMARLSGCRVIGIAGSDDKCDMVCRLGCEAAINYRQEDVPARLETLCPQGIDLYFDNVGGEILSACLDRLAFNARIVLCGSISEYARETPFGLTNYTALRRVNGTMRGFFVYHFADRFDEAISAMSDWIRQGTIEPREQRVQGFENMPEALRLLYTGGNAGALCCQVAEEPEGDEQA